MLDTEVTGFLLIGNLGFGLKTHGVTLHEVGRIQFENVPDLMLHLRNIPHMAGHLACVFRPFVPLACDDGQLVKGDEADLPANGASWLAPWNSRVHSVLGVAPSDGTRFQQVVDNVACESFASLFDAMGRAVERNVDSMNDIEIAMRDVAQVSTPMARHFLMVQVCDPGPMPTLAVLMVEMEQIEKEAPLPYFRGWSRRLACIVSCRDSIHREWDERVRSPLLLTGQLRGMTCG